ncbi:MAG: PQQ-dependent dehydrogenase, methanol/ethanol family [Gemmatimonadota bacterium]|nr:PQQ-dependent dehydrogenase, methanol/ethanol family [Gemmatimonadota bacterium]
MTRFLPLLALPTILLGVRAPLGAQGAAPVTEAALIEADPAEWLTYGRDYAETHYSPLDRINSDNVGRLGLAWFWTNGGGAGRVEATPLVSNGVIYATATWSVVFALDARTGEQIWRWEPGIVRGGRRNGGPSICCQPVNRGVALYNGKVYAGLLDGRLVALDAATGRLVWAVQTTPVGDLYSVTMAPRVVKGNVIIGNSGAEFGVRGYVTAYDAETGEQTWRTYTVPGNPALGFESEAMRLAARTWFGTWWEGGGGGTVWDGVAFDPVADLLYVGTGNGSPWSRFYRSLGAGDNLYLSSILALNPDDGELVWHYQTAPGDDWDYTAVQPMILADLVIDGEERQVLMQAPKNGFFYVLDRITGELLSAEAYAHVTWAYGIDLETGRPIEAPEARYDETDGAWLSPSAGGGHNWQPMSWNPQTGLVYIPTRTNQRFNRLNREFERRVGATNTGTTGRGAPEPPELPGTPGHLLAWDPLTQQERWRFPNESQRNGGTVSTAGNLVFSATEQGLVYALDATTGELLWEVQLPGGSAATPVTYELDGQQYVSILVGNGPTDRLWTFVLDGNAPIPEG